MSHRVTLQPGGEVFEVATGQNVLEAALDAGLNLPHSCRSGSCLSCQARITDGTVTYPGGLPPGLTAAEAASGQALLCRALASSDLVVETRPVEIPADIRIRRLPARVERLERRCHDVMSVYLKLPAFEPFEFLAGQYVDVLLADGRRRSFSIASAPHEPGPLEIQVRHVPDGYFTGHVFDAMKEKALLRLEGPLGSFYLREDSDRPILMMGGGTGFAPLQGMLRHAAETGMDRPVELYWGVRRREDLYAVDEVERLSSLLPGLTFHPVFSEETGAVEAQARQGWVHEVLLADHPDLAGFDVYMSGPPVMIEAARTAFAAAGLPPERLYFDSFDYAPDTRPATLTG